MEGQKKAFIQLTFFFAFGAILLICISLGTDHWVESEPHLKQNVTSTSPSLMNFTSNSQSRMNFGLFKGEGSINHGIGEREKHYTTVCSASKGVCVMFAEGDNYDSGFEYIDSVLSSNKTEEEYEAGLFKYGYWLMTIVSASMAIVMGLIAMGFAVFNVCGKPIETLTGPMGLYVWNGVGFLLVLLEMAMFLAMFFTSLKKNFIMVYYERFYVEDYTNPGYSFYLVPVAGAFYLINLFLLFVSGYKLRCSFSSEAEKGMDNGVILY